VNKTVPKLRARLFRARMRVLADPFVPCVPS
jgi:hypothetical protein